MRIVADTNVIVSAFLWGGTPRRLLHAVEAKGLELFTSRALIAELEEVLLRAKFADRLGRTRFSAAFLLARYTQLATLIEPTEAHVPELRDRDDAAVLACALTARADLIVSGDQDLLTLKTYQGHPHHKRRRSARDHCKKALKGRRRQQKFLLTAPMFSSRRSWPRFSTRALSRDRSKSPAV